MMLLNRFGWRALSGCLALVLLTSTGRTAPERRQDLPAALDDLARGVKAVVEKAEQKSVRIGRFAPSGLDEANAGDGISAGLAHALGNFVDPRSSLEVAGVYGFINDEKVAGARVIKIRAKIVNTQTLEELKAFLPLDAVIRANGDIARFLGVTGRVPPENSYEKRNKEIQKHRQEPSVHVHGEANTLISSAKDSPYAVEIRVKPLKDHDKHQAAARGASVENGQAFVSIDRGELYEVRLINSSDHETAITLSVDGIDVFTFSENRRADGRPKFTHFIVPPAKDGKPGESIIRGWHRTVDKERTDNFLSFLVTEYGKGAASKFPTHSQGKVGVIHVSFALAFPEGEARGAGSETGFGPPVQVKQEVVKRVIDPPLDFVSVRYAR